MAKTIFRRFFWISLLALLVACGNQTVAAPIGTLAPTIVSSTPVPTSTILLIIITPSPMPTQPFLPLITPDAIQVARWKEYEAALAMSLNFPPQDTLCEWDILGTDEKVLYVWVVCESILPIGITSTGKNLYPLSSTPALIRIKNDGTIDVVDVPGPGVSNYPKMFPDYIQAKFEFYRFGRAGEMSNHIEWRRTHPEAPPLIILSATPTP